MMGPDIGQIVAAQAMGPSKEQQFRLTAINVAVALLDKGGYRPPTLKQFCHDIEELRKFIDSGNGIKSDTLLSKN